MRYAMRRSSDPLVDAQDREEQGRTEYVLSAGLVTLLGAMIRRLIRHPSAFVTALRTAMSLGAVSETRRVKHMVYLAEAAYVAERCQVRAVSHIHAQLRCSASSWAAQSSALRCMDPKSLTRRARCRWDAK